MKKYFAIALATVLAVLLSACWSCKNHVAIEDILDKEWTPIYVENTPNLEHVSELTYCPDCEHIRMKFFALNNENPDDKLALGGEMRGDRMFGGIVTFKDGNTFDLSNVVIWKGGKYDGDLKPYDDYFMKALRESSLCVWDEFNDTLYFYAIRNHWQVLTLKFKNTENYKPCPYCENRKRATPYTCKKNAETATKLYEEESK